MEKVAQQLESLLKQGANVFMHASESELSLKQSPDKWSKREVLGHLIDSALHNLVRFTECRYLPKPYRHRPYDQNELVRLNDYQHTETEDLLVLWLSLNRRIVALVSDASESDLEIPIAFADGTVKDLRFLMSDYADHLEHHLRQLERISR